MARVLLSLLILGAGVAAQDDDIARARERVRALEVDIRRSIARAAPSVGAVVNYAALIDVKTGAVALRPRGFGSGVVISRDGFFLTNVHVIERAGHLTVTLPDGVSYFAKLHADTREGRVKGDIALLKLQGKDRFEYVDWRKGSPGSLEPGNVVFAMGNPHGHAIDGTPVVTLGILSGKGRPAAEAGYLYIDALQTDAEINPGNSGGPLFDARGNLIGINGLMKSRQGRSSSGVGFAIPIDQIRRFLPDLMRDEGGGTGYGYHGLDVQSAPKERGAVVAAVARGSPADEAGLRRGDVITRVNRAKVANRTDLVNILGKLPAGREVVVAYRRDRRSKMSKFRLTSYEDYLESIGRSRSEAKPQLPPHERGHLGIHWKVVAPGLEVTKVLPGTGAERSGLEVGDLLLRVEDESVEDPKKLLRFLGSFGVGESVRVTYRRGSSRRSARLRLCDAAQMAGILE
jgi:serine protease Do